MEIKDNNYKLQNSCINCEFVIKSEDLDFIPCYYCNVNDDEVDEFFCYPEFIQDRYKWEREHLVKINGICDEYKKNIEGQFK